MFHEQSANRFQCLDTKNLMDQEIAIEDLVILHMYQWEALMRVLERKGLLTNLEVMEEIESLKLEHEAAMGKGPEAQDGLPGG
jgi:hypothetical protein